MDQLPERIVQAERSNDLFTAARAYEEFIATGEATLDAFLNLSVLYFVSMDGGADVVLESAWERQYEVLDEAEARFGRHLEIDFWRAFFRFIWGDTSSLDTELCQRILGSGATRVPAMALYGSFCGLSPGESAQYRSMALALYDEVKDGTTAMHRYVRSVVESALAQRSEVRWRPH